MKYTSLLLALTTFFACRTATDVVLDNDLKTNATALAVKGRQGWQIGQVISFGDYKTDRVKRGWTSGYKVPFIIQFAKAKEKLSYRQFGPAGLSAEVACVSKFESKEINLIGEFFAIPLQYENYFAGSVVVDDSRSWDFLIHNVDGNRWGDSTDGLIRQGEHRIDIVGLRLLEGQPEWMNVGATYGYEFRRNGKVIGTVSTFNRGKIWLHNDLDAELKLVLAGVSTGLLLRHNVEDTARAM